MGQEDIENRLNRRLNSAAKAGERATEENREKASFSQKEQGALGTKQQELEREALMELGQKIAPYLHEYQMETHRTLNCAVKRMCDIEHESGVEHLRRYFGERASYFLDRHLDGSAHGPEPSWGYGTGPILIMNHAHKDAMVGRIRTLVLARAELKTDSTQQAEADNIVYYAEMQRFERTEKNSVDRHNPSGKHLFGRSWQQYQHQGKFDQDGALEFMKDRLADHVEVFRNKGAVRAFLGL